MRTLFLATFCCVIAGCGSTRPVAKQDPTAEAWYADAARQLAEWTREADGAYLSGKPDDAARLIKKAEPLRDKVVAVSKPTLAAMQAAADLDDLYARMLFGNRHYGWARLLFQKNVARWKHWDPQTPDTMRRYAAARTQVAECDQRMSQQVNLK